MEDLSKRIEDLSPEKRALLLMRLKKLRETSNDLDSNIPRRKDLSVFPMSYAQQRMWFLSQWEPESPFYNIPSIIKITGTLDVLSLNKAINQVYYRHEILRARIKSVEGKPTQSIDEGMDLDIKMIEISSLAEEEKKIRVDFLISEEIHTSFDLSDGPLIRAKIIIVSQEEFILLVTMHHIVSDGWSIGIFIREVSYFYQIFTSGNNDPGLPELIIQYPDFANWQILRLRQPYLQELIDYWKDQLNENQDFLELPLDFVRPGIQTFIGAHLNHAFPETLRNRLVEFCKIHEVSLFMLLLSGFQVLLFRYTQQEIIRVGIPVANRNRKELEGLIGLFVNTIVIQGNLTSNLSFLDLLNQIKERVLGGYTHQELPLEMLLEELIIPRDLSYTPLFQVMFALQTAASESLRISNLQFNILEPENGTSKFDLTLFLEEKENGLEAIFEYSTDLFRPDTISRMANQLEILITGILDDSTQAIGKLPLLSNEEKQKLLITWNENLSNYPYDKNLAELFESVADIYSDSSAVIFPGSDNVDRVVTYRELNTQANQLARYIQTRSGQTGKPIALFMDRSLEMVVATLAIIKAGCAYLPIDLGYPAERVAFMLDDGQVPVIITTTSNLGFIRELPYYSQPGSLVKIICIDDDEESRSISLESPENLQDYPSAETVAYIMYTSGSTGKPKGVAVPHRAIARLVFNTNYLNYGPEGRIAHISNPSFDAATYEIWGVLLHGGQLVGIPKEIALNTQKYVQFIRDRQITSTFLTVALFNNIVREEPNAFESMDTVMFGGEAADLGSVRRVLAHNGPKRLVNAYGPTESTTFAAWYLVDDLSEKIKSLPIGKPINNTLLYILDENLEPVPVGVPGELYIGGDGLAVGYFHRPDLTSEKFLPNPFIDAITTTPGIHIHDNRIYKTGDRVRYLPDGNIEFLGRFDFQVKLRGLRIELGEIESAIGSHASIAGNIVIMREDSSGDKRLVCYYVTKDSGKININEFKEFLKNKIPDFMIPSGFVYLDRFPLNPNGKIDRKQLPVPGDVSFGASDTFVSPTNPDEEILFGIWKDLLGLQRISIHDNFFALGGHSLLVTQLVSRIRSLFAIDLNIKNIFENPTIFEQAIAIKTKRLSEPTLQLPELVSISRDIEIPLTFSQQRLWFLEQLKPNSPDYNIPTSVRITGDLDELTLRKCLNTLVNRHESLRMVINTTDGRPSLSVLTDLELPYRSVDCSSLDDSIKETEVNKIIRAEAQLPFVLSEGPLVRFLCIRVDADQYIFLLIFHHIVSDGWSANIFYKELASLYTAFKQDKDSPLQPLPYQYVDYAVWQRKVLQGDFLEKELAYWKQKLADAPQLLDLPTDFARPAIQSGQGDFITFEVDSETTQNIAERCGQEGVTLFMYLLSVFGILLNRYTNQADLSIGTPIANREHEGIESIIGFFVNTLVIRINLDGEPSFSDVLHQVRSTAMEAYTHSTLPFEMVVDALDPVRDLSFNPIFQAMFTLQEDTEPGYKQLQSTLALEPIDIHGGISIFDLTLSLAISGEKLRGAIEYCTDLFYPETISRMITHFLTLLGEFTRNPAVNINKPSLISPDEFDTIRSWNQTSEAIPQACLHELFHEAVLLYPEQTAILEANSGGKNGLTYQELDRRSTILANYLNQLGIGTNHVVGLCLERTINLYISLLGILKSGAAYLPLDPTYPKDRLDYMVIDSEVDTIISQQSFAGSLSEFRVRLIEIDKDWKYIEEHSNSSQNIIIQKVTPSHPAYIIYTSGSTGKPKGVLVSHRSVVNHNLAIKNAFRLGGEDRVLQFSTINFDAAVEEIFPTWLSGATVVIPPLSMITRGSLLITPKDLTDLVNREKITILDFSTAFWHEWVYELGKSLEFPPSIRLVVVGGEKARRDVYDKWWDAVHDKAVWLNTYGPTEAAIVATIYTPDRALPDGQDIPIGKPITNMHAHILDRNLNLAPIGLPGELFLGGAGVAIGYLNQPELNHSKFFQDILFPEERMYKTGDKARWLTDGNIEFLGRFDSQVKIRGFRIEINEIESHILACPLVKDGVVIPGKKGGESGSGSQFLAAYIVLKQPDETSEGEIRSYLKTKLPDYMIPSMFLFLDQLPKLPNGKLDRKNLPDLVDGSHTSGRKYSEPRNEIEKQLVGIWQEVLGVKTVGIYDNFFELGGDSILSIQVVSRARKVGLKLQPRQIFEAQTIAELTGFVGDEVAFNNGDGTQGEVQGDVILTPIQRWFFDQEFEEIWHWNQAIMVEVKQKLDPEYLKETLRLLISHHDALRIRFQKNEFGKWGGKINSLDADIPFNVIDLSELSGFDLMDYISDKVEEFQKSLNIQEGPILRLVYFQCGKNTSDRLFMVIHHLVVDGVSWRIILDDLQSLYDQLSRGNTPTLPLKTTSIKEWAEKLSEYAQTDALIPEVSFWQEITGGKISPLPVDNPNRLNLQCDEGIIQVFIDETMTESLLREIPVKFGADVNEALIAVLVRTITSWTNSPQIRIDIEGHGREEIINNVDLSRTVGWFTSVYPVVFDDRGYTNIQQALISTKERLRTIPNNGFNYGIIKYLSSLESDDRTESSEISYNYLGQVFSGKNSNILFGIAKESVGHSLSPKNRRSHLIDFVASIIDGRLCLEWRYNEKIHFRETIEKLSEEFKLKIEELNRLCKEAASVVYSPSDFKDVDLRQDEIDLLLEELGIDDGELNS